MADGIDSGRAAIVADGEHRLRRVIAQMRAADIRATRLSGFAESCTLLDDWNRAPAKDRIEVLIVKQIALATNGSSVILSAGAANELADESERIILRDGAEITDPRAIADMARALRMAAQIVARPSAATVVPPPPAVPTDRNDTAATAPGTVLRDKLRGRGAKPHRRLSDLSRYMLAHHDELHALITVDRYGWADIASLLAEDEGLTDELGRPVTADIAKLTWSRLTRRTQEYNHSVEPEEDAGLCDREWAVSDPPTATLVDFDASADLAAAKDSLQAVRSGPLRLLRAAYWATGDRGSSVAVHDAIEYVSSALRALQRCKDN